jgi:hypothetical protein
MSRTRRLLPLLVALAIAVVAFLVARAFGVYVVFLPFVFVPFVWRRRA